MSKHPVKIVRSTLRHAQREAAEIAPAPAEANMFTSFRYASAEITVHGGKAHVRARRTQWEDGKLSSEAFDGEVDRTVYERAVLQAQRHFIDQTLLFWQSMTSFLPFAGKRSRDRD
jgi:hypothetical protein